MFALLGAVSLLGCVLANAIVLVEFINDELASGLPLEDACKSAGGKRVRPIMMSTMTTVLGLLPLALFGDANVCAYGCSYDGWFGSFNVYKPCSCAYDLLFGI